MRLLALTSVRHSIPSLQKLRQEGLLTGLILPDRLSEDTVVIRRWAEHLKIPVVLCTYASLEKAVINQMSETPFDAAMVFGFPWKIPTVLRSLVPLGFINVHFSLLPAYRGPSPVFWQLRNGETSTGITIHRIDDGFDSGPIVGVARIPVIPGENEGYCLARLAQVAVGLVSRIVSNLENALNDGKTQDEQQASYYSRPDEAAVCINWQNDSSQQIQNLINACNPDWKGALCQLNGQPIRILEVSPTDGPDYPGQKAGTVIHADPQAGIFVICADRQVLRLNILHTTEGIFSGGKMAALGIVAGNCFESIPQPINSSKNQTINIHLQT